MTTPVSPQRLLADQMPGPVDQRWDIAADQLRALAEHGYAVVSVLEPDQRNTDAGVLLSSEAGQAGD